MKRVEDYYYPTPSQLIDLVGSKAKAMIDTRDSLNMKLIMYKMLQNETRISSLQTSDNFWRPGHTNCSKSSKGKGSSGAHDHSRHKIATHSKFTLFCPAFAPVTNAGISVANPGIAKL